MSNKRIKVHQTVYELETKNENFGIATWVFSWLLSNEIDEKIFNKVLKQWIIDVRNNEKRTKLCKENTKCIEPNGFNADAKKGCEWNNCIFRSQCKFIIINIFQLEIYWCFDSFGIIVSRCSLRFFVWHSFIKNFKRCEKCAKEKIWNLLKKNVQIWSSW